jgi:O-antigen biosynthesis protein
MISETSVIVTNWNGLRLLQKNLETIIQNSPEANEIILADDASSDQSLNYVSELQKKYPQIKIIHHSKNVGFSKNSNHAVKASSGDFVVMLNNDILPHTNYISEAVKHFSDHLVFGVGLAEFNNENWGMFYWSGGYLQYKPGLKVNKTHITGWLSGGSAIVNRNLFLKLNGFDEIYAPFYSEDLDLGYRAWKSGYKLLWEPKSIVEHKHEATISKFPKRLLDYVKERNRLLTVWRNITDPKLLTSNKLALIGRVLTGPNYLKIILAAKRQLKKFPPPTVFPKKSDREILSLFKND